MDRRPSSLLLLPLLLASALAWLSISDYNSSFDGYPDVFLIGAAKGGTTSIAYFLVNTLKLYVESGGRKEPIFFVNFNDKEFNRYISGFDEEKMRKGDLSTFDGSVQYFQHQDVWMKMKRLYTPECLRKKKFILSLREPIAREVSWFHHYYGNCLRSSGMDCSDHIGGSGINDTFHKYVARLDASPIHQSYYLPNLKSLLEVISRDQIFIFSFEALVGDDGQDIIDRLLNFLGVESAESSAALFPQANSAEKRCGEFCEEEELHEFLCSDFRHLNQIYSRVNAGLVEFINSDPNRPPSEPVFRQFAERLSEKCLEADGSLVDFN